MAVHVNEASRNVNNFLIGLGRISTSAPPTALKKMLPQTKELETGPVIVVHS